MKLASLKASGRDGSLVVVDRSLQNYVAVPQIIQTYGYVPIAISFLGLIFLIMKGGKKNLSLILGLLALLLMLVIFFRFNEISRVYGTCKSTIVRRIG